MPTLDQHKAATFVKALVIGDSGAGKTGALASLAKAGYNLYIVDFDGNLGILYDLLKSDPKAQSRVNFETCKDKLVPLAGKVMYDGIPTAIAHAFKLLSNWPGKGPLTKWTEDDVLVIDTLTTMGMAAMRYQLALTGHEEKASLPDYGAAMDQIDKAVQLMTSPATNCHVIMNSHINYTESAEGAGAIKGYPSALGNKLSPKIPIYFENVLFLKTIGAGATRKREFYTKGDSMIEGKSPVSVPAVMPQDTGLAEFFKILRGGKTPTAK